MTSSLPSLTQAERIVVKIGSATVADPLGATPKLEWMQSLAADIATLVAAGKEIILVSSGAVALGRPHVGLDARKLSLEEKQAAAAAGQPLLMQAWQQAFAGHHLKVAQLLLTLEDSERRNRYLNARATFETLLAHKLIPVVNENDTVATAELKFGDNDRLAARVAVMTGADVLVLLSDVDGLYDSDPRKNKSAKHLPRIDAITPEILAMGGDAASGLSNGGMRTKIEAARMAMAAGCHMVIARGDAQHPLRALSDGGRASWFVATTQPQIARKHWIATSVASHGALLVDAGAAKALAEGKSLLPAGVKQVEGNFARGDTVAVKAPDGQVIARGISNYSSAEAVKIAGQKTGAIESILGYAGRDTLIHRDDLAML